MGGGGGDNEARGEGDEEETVFTIGFHGRLLVDGSGFVGWDTVRPSRHLTGIQRAKGIQNAVFKDFWSFCRHSLAKPMYEIQLPPKAPLVEHGQRDDTASLAEGDSPHTGLQFVKARVVDGWVETPVEADYAPRNSQPSAEVVPR